jgi:hypothetical protein
MISDGASQATGGFARKTCLLAEKGDTKVLTDAKSVNCVVVQALPVTAWRRLQASISWPKSEKQEHLGGC